MAEPKVSVIVPVFNGARFLDECLASILAQEHRPLEVVVVDDGSTDDSVAIARRRSAVRVIEQEHAGVAVARNAGVAAASGEFVGFCDQDDRWTPNKLEVQLPRMLARPELAFTLAYLRVFLEDGYAPPSWLQVRALERPVPGWVTGTLLARAATFSAVGMFDPTCADACDADWLLRARDAQLGFEVLPDALLEKRTHSENTSRQIEHCQRLTLEAVRRSVARRKSKASPGS